MNHTTDWGRRWRNTGYITFFLSGICAISSGIIVSILQGKYELIDRKFTVIVSGQNAELKWQVVSPIICAGDAIGSVVILAKDGRKKPGELEQKMILCAAGFLGRQMEQ